jgi:hypothetical protein
MTEQKPMNKEESDKPKVITILTKSSSNVLSVTGLDIAIGFFAVGLGLSIGLTQGYRLSNWMWDSNFD